MRGKGDMTSIIIVSDTDAVEGQRLYNQITDPLRVCTKCVHFQVRTIHRQIKRQIKRAISVEFNDVKPPSR